MIARRRRGTLWGTASQSPAGLTFYAVTFAPLAPVTPTTVRVSGGVVSVGGIAACITIPRAEEAPALSFDPQQPRGLAIAALEEGVVWGIAYVASMTLRHFLVRELLRSLQGDKRSLVTVDFSPTETVLKVGHQALRLPPTPRDTLLMVVETYLKNHPPRRRASQD